jgi:hypothetical protein
VPRSRYLGLFTSGCAALAVALSLLSAQADDRVTGLAFGGALGLLALGVIMAMRGSATSNR